MTPLLLILAFIAAEGGTMTTVVGTGEPGFSGDGGPAAQARLNSPFDVAFDSTGHLYLSDTFNHRVRRVDAKTGVIATVAGRGTKGFAGDGGPATEAQLDEPYGLAFDLSDNLYIADRLNRRVRRVDARTGAITTAAGDGSPYKPDVKLGQATSIGLAEPNGVALDIDGRLLIADVAANRVWAVRLGARRIYPMAGTGQARHDGDDGLAADASLFGARAVDVGPDQTVYILERQGNTLRAVDPSTLRITTVAGTGEKGYSGDGGPAGDATFDGPKELAIDRDGNIFIVDTENHAIRRINAKTRVITTVAGDGYRGDTGDGGPATAARLDRPHGVAIDGRGRLFIGDTGNHRIRRVGP